MSILDRLFSYPFIYMLYQLKECFSLKHPEKRCSRLQKFTTSFNELIRCSPDFKRKKMEHNVLLPK